MNVKVNKRILLISVACFLVAAMAFASLAIDAQSEWDFLPAVSIIIAACVWAFTIAGIVLQVILSIKVHKWEKQNRNLLNGKGIRKRIGLFSFFENPVAIACDVLLLFALIVFAITFRHSGSSLLFAISIFLIFFTFCARCVFNGKSYYYIENYKQITGR